MNIVFTNGCFDIIHIGHIKLFKYCKLFGQYLVVGIDSDDRIRSSKGIERPINCAKDRKELLLSIKYVDRVEIFDSDDQLRDLVRSVAPSCMVVGSDWQNKTIIGSEFAKDLKFFNRVEPYASTKIIQNIIDRG